MTGDLAGLEQVFRSSLRTAGVPAAAIPLPTGWPVGPVFVFLFGDRPVTLVDCGVDSEESLEQLGAALGARGLRTGDVERVVVTHGHGDHFGAAWWLQEASGCDVLLHSLDVERLEGDFDWTGLLVGLGVPEEDAVRTVRRRRRRLPSFTPMTGGEVIPAGATRLRVDHRPGHSPGHCLLHDDASRAIFSGDYLLASEASNPGIDLDPDSPSGRRPMLRLLEEGLRSIVESDATVAFPSHGPPIERPGLLAAKRLSQSGRRTARVERVLATDGPITAYELAVKMFGKRMSRNLFELVADSAGRLDLLVEIGAADARERGGVWYFSARKKADGDRGEPRSEPGR